MGLKPNLVIHIRAEHRN